MVQPEQISDNFMPFIPVQEELGNAEDVYALSDPARSIIRVLTASALDKLCDQSERQAEIARCIAYSRNIADEFTQLKNLYGIKTPGMSFVIGTPKNTPGAVALYANVERVHGESLPTALDTHSVPDKVYDQYLVGQVQYVMDCLKTGTPCRSDIVGRDVQYIYGHVEEGDAGDEIYLVDVGDTAKEVPAADLIVQSSRRSPDGSRKTPYYPLGALIDNLIYFPAYQSRQRESEGYWIPRASEAFLQARVDLRQLWPKLVQPLEDKYRFYEPHNLEFRA